LRHEGKPELPPPEVNDPQQKRGRPTQVEQRNPLAPWVLNKTCESAEQRRNAEADDDRDNNPDVLI